MIGLLRTFIEESAFKEIFRTLRMAARCMDSLSPLAITANLQTSSFSFQTWGPFLRQKNNIEEALKPAGGRVAELRKMA